jgi:hypothetical protein
MANAKAKGNRLEMRAKKELEEDGYLVERARGIPIWIAPGKCIVKAVDFFNTYDLIAVGHGLVRFIQITTFDVGTFSEKKKKVAERAEYFGDQCSMEIWRWKDREGWRKIEYDNGEWVEME